MGIARFVIFAAGTRANSGFDGVLSPLLLRARNAFSGNLLASQPQRRQIWDCIGLGAELMVVMMMVMMITMITRW